MKIRWFGTAALEISTDRTKLLFDPFIPLKGARNAVDVRRYTEYRNILITHGHFDHIASLPQIMRGSDAKIFCTRTPEETLRRKGIGADHFHRIRPGDAFVIGDIEVSVYQSRHVCFDRPLLIHTFLSPRMLRYCRNLPWIVRENKACKENGEIVGYLLKSGGRSIYVMGSLNIDRETEYPTGMDALVLPYQGTTDPAAAAMPIIERLKPNNIFADHFDDAFPPLSRDISAEDLRGVLQGRIPVTTPEPGIEYLVSDDIRRIDK